MSTTKPKNESGSDQIWEKFRSQRKKAKQRDIGWDFSFSDWCNWWEDQLGPNWVALRGKRRGQYVMARRGDKGPYAAWNVEAKLGSENVSEQKANGTRACDSRRGSKGSKNCKAVLTDVDVIEIRRLLSTGANPMKVAVEYGVSFSTIYRIKARKLWGHV